MSTYHVKPSFVSGEIVVPPSKSHTLRAILFGSLGKGKSHIHNYLDGTDTQAMIEACRLLGATIDVSKESLVINGLNGTITHAEDVINAGNSGIVLRFCAAVGALGELPIVLTGDHSIRHRRPMTPLIEGLRQLGVSVKSMRGDNMAPVIIQGKMQPGSVTIDGQDSQPVSALLIAAGFADGPTEIIVRNPGEKPWINLTLDWLQKLGIKYENHNFERYYIPGKSRYEGFDYRVPGDFSSAAFPIAAALVTKSELTIHNLDMTDLQGDKELIDVFQKMGAKINYDDKKRVLHVEKGAQLKGVKVDINDFVDAITILAVVACYAEGETIIENATIARQKECNRISSIATELQKMGADIAETEDGLRIRYSPLKGAQLKSYHDHRMVMSLSVAALGAQGETSISDAECVSKTYPTFMQDFTKIGAKITLEDRGE